jgi:hypothetical protein
LTLTFGHAAFSQFCETTQVEAITKVGADVLGKIMQEDGTCWNPFCPAFLKVHQFLTMH